MWLQTLSAPRAREFGMAAAQSILVFFLASFSLCRCLRQLHCFFFSSHTSDRAVFLFPFLPLAFFSSFHFFFLLCGAVNVRVFFSPFPSLPPCVWLPAFQPWHSLGFSSFKFIGFSAWPCFLRFFFVFCLVLRFLYGLVLRVFVLSCVFSSSPSPCLFRIHDGCRCRFPWRPFFPFLFC